LTDKNIGMLNAKLLSRGTATWTFG
jgi:hypothetical protein